MIEAQRSLQVHNFNKTYSIGSKVKIQKDDGSIQVCTVRHPASQLCDGTPVAWLAEITGAYALERVIY